MRMTKVDEVIQLQTANLPTSYIKLLSPRPHENKQMQRNFKHALSYRFMFVFHIILWLYNTKIFMHMYTSMRWDTEMHWNGLAINQPTSLQ